VKILLDEGVSNIIQNRLSHLSISTIEEMGWRGIKNGTLLDFLTDKFQVLITTDKNIAYQQNLAKRRIAAIILPANEIPTVKKLLPQIEKALVALNPGEIATIPGP
jgi:hypothetical protein